MIFISVVKIEVEISISKNEHTKELSEAPWNDVRNEAGMCRE